MIEEWEKNRRQANNCEIGHLGYKFKTPPKIELPYLLTSYFWGLIFQFRF
jgi:hypothetical protein